MQEIRWHGRGGNGAFTAARLLALAASVYGGRYAQAFPSFGPERRGAPVLGFSRIDDSPIRDHSEVADCDCVIVLDETLMSALDVFKGLKANGAMVLNSAKTKAELQKDERFAGVKNLTALDATSIALDVLKSPIVNTIMLGAAIAATDMIAVADAESAIDELMPRHLTESNKLALRAAYDKVKGENP
ncbi:pyruvate ferredoxin oxidoreductase subunit gamma [Synergistales bacterium]|nr:pyruvate ferredoxin oxidoreductase subunit gamma [Synergistales bacterium]